MFLRGRQKYREASKEKRGGKGREEEKAEEISNFEELKLPYLLNEQQQGEVAPTTRKPNLALPDDKMPM